MACLAFSTLTVEYLAIFSPNAMINGEEHVLFLPSQSDYENVEDLLKVEHVIKNVSSFDRVANWMDYKGGKISSGKYTVKKGQSNKESIANVRSGRQTPIIVTFNNLRTKEELAGKN